MWKKGVQVVTYRSVMSLCAGAKTGVRVDSEWSDEFEVKLGIHWHSMNSPFYSCGRCCHWLS